MVTVVKKTKSQNAFTQDRLLNSIYLLGLEVSVADHFREQQYTTVFASEFNINNILAYLKANKISLVKQLIPFGVHNLKGFTITCKDNKFINLVSYPKYKFKVHNSITHENVFWIDKTDWFKYLKFVPVVKKFKPVVKDANKLETVQTEITPILSEPTINERKQYIKEAVGVAVAKPMDLSTLLTEEIDDMFTELQVLPQQSEIFSDHSMSVTF